MIFHYSSYGFVLLDDVIEEFESSYTMVHLPFDFEKIKLRINKENPWRTENSLDYCWFGVLYFCMETEAVILVIYDWSRD